MENNWHFWLATIIIFVVISCIVILCLIHDLCSHLLRCCVHACSTHCQKSIVEWLKSNGFTTDDPKTRITNSEIELQTVIEEQIAASRPNSTLFSVNMTQQQQYDVVEINDDVIRMLKEVDGAHVTEILPMIPETPGRVVDLVRPPPYNPDRDYFE